MRGSCGPGNLHLINGLFDANRSGVPVLAIAAQIPAEEIGSEYFQETHPQLLFGECSVYCELASVPEQVPRLTEMACGPRYSAAASAWWSSPASFSWRARPPERGLRRCGRYDRWSGLTITRCPRRQGC